MPRIREKPKLGRSRGWKEFDPIVADDICHKICQGKTLESIISTPGMPTRVTVWRWQNQHPEFLAEFERAQRLAADAIAERAHDRALSVKDPDDVPVVQLGLKSSQWMAGKLSPARWADKVAVSAKHEHSGPNGGPIELRIQALIGLVEDSAIIDRLADHHIAAIREAVLLLAAPPPASGMPSAAGPVIEGVAQTVATAGGSRSAEAAGASGEEDGGEDASEG